jgi:tRNA(Ile)-lysidine synthase
MLENLNQILREECQLDPAKPILVGVSGGPDSLCTLDVLERCGYSPVVAHFNHKLRPEADAESEVIRQLAEKRNLPFIKGEIDVRTLAEKGHQSIEEAARNARYRFLFTTADRVVAQAVAVGHSADDQAETVLMHLLRGAGLDGLSGMVIRALPNAWSEQIPLVRPLLGVWRAQIIEYCQEQGFDPIIDSTNQDLTFFRNRIRHELLPNLESYNPSIRKVLWRTAEVLRGDMELVNQAVDTAWQECLVSEGSNYVVIDPQPASQQPLSVQRHLIRRAIASLRPGLRDIGFNTVEQVRKYFQDSQPPAEIDLIAGLKLLSEPGRIWLAEWETDIPSSEWPQILEEVLLPIPGAFDLPNGWRLTVEKVTTTNITRSQAQNNFDPYQAWIDAKHIQEPLIVRPRREGDRFLPFGMDGHSIKISDFMINEKLPRRARRSWPLVCCAEQIVWVPGYRLAHPFCITDSTTQAVQLKLMRSDLG